MGLVGQIEGRCRGGHRNAEGPPVQAEQEGGSGGEYRRSALAGARSWVFTVRSPVATELWEAELILGNLSPCRMPVLRVQMMPSG